MSHSTDVPRRPVLLIILDGFGVNPSKINNAIADADTPHLDTYFAQYPLTLLNASGPAVGLPEGQMGNSEVGHLTLGCGHIIRQDTLRIDDAITSGEFYTNPALLKAIDSAKARKRPVHLLGLVSDGGVHSSLNHLYALIDLCKQKGVKPLLHMISDGRDTPPQSALSFLHELEPYLHECGGAIATLSGRYYAMDRDRRWERTELAWRALVLGKGQRGLNVATAIKSAYAAGDNDEFIRPIVFPTHEKLEAGDQLISFNFRKDRPRQIVEALGCQQFTGFDRGQFPLVYVTCMMPYDRSFNLPYVFEPETPQITLGQVVSDAGIAQFRCAETEKYPHVTYFFNGGRQQPYHAETQYLVPSPKVSTYDLKPEMSAAQVTDAVIDAIGSAQYGFMVVNFANGDMVGHTANHPATVKAVETLDKQVERVISAAVARNYSVILTADHGNCEKLYDPNSNSPHTQHTSYPVPCAIIDEQYWRLSSSGGLSNIAPTVLQLMGLEIPPQMSATSLLLNPNAKPRQLNRRRLESAA